MLNTAVTDLTMTLIVALARQLFPYEAYARSGRWAERAPRLPLGHDIHGKVLGVIGYGRIGREVTRRMQLLGMRTLWTDVFDTPPDGAPESEYRPFDDLLRESDFVSLHTDLNETSRALIGARELALMHNGALPHQHLARSGRRSGRAPGSPRSGLDRRRGARRAGGGAA